MEKQLTVTFTEDRAHEILQEYDAEILAHETAAKELKATIARLTAQEFEQNRLAVAAKGRRDRVYRILSTAAGRDL